MDYNVIGSDLQANDCEPMTFSKPQIKHYHLKIPFIELEPKDINAKYQKLQLLRLKIQHEKFRAEKWMIYKNSRKKKHMLYMLSNEIKSEE